eukprot:c24026_g1_i3 orf=404-676(+)
MKPPAISKCLAYEKPATAANFSCSFPVGKLAIDVFRYSYSSRRPYSVATGTTPLSNIHSYHRAVNLMLEPNQPKLSHFIELKLEVFTPRA